ncbi:PREDICTED: uncharacterized protein LOC109581011 [Amphimedon queenslandica]|uniref:Fibronectin type-III domain-containing protein n=1 Tax=Amphimedon queenslandica TaxID=400682 RepID=A0AAN0IZU1_AMPQE|nr:PREDICTED: uncharacterized protein LOC109581011 [Amphimedon queenslandica]|eukprot:XP_019850280.1 PREDICTED: uncharacterized protein LOC109581011 [Amphimedon queenslandica]
MVDDDDFDIQMLQFSNSTNGNTFITITGLNDMSCYIFGVRAYTDRGPGSWRVVANETLISQNVCIGSNDEEAVDGASIGLGAVVGLLTISLVISIIINIYCFIKFKSYYAKETNKFNDDIPMQACESYVVHKTKDTKDTTKDSLYECPDINVYDDAIYVT